jgi:hypothetical protein
MAIQSITQDSAFESFDGGSGGGGGGGTYTAPTIRPTLRIITFNVESRPNGAAIFVNGVNTGYTTPHTLQYTEGELSNGGKIVTLVNGSVNSEETFILSSQVISEPVSIPEPRVSSGGGGGGGRIDDFGDRNFGDRITDRDSRELQAF